MENNRELEVKENGTHKEVVPTLWPSVPVSESDYIVPVVDIVETSEGITLKADMPGVTKERLTISLDNDVVTLEGRIELDVPKEAEPLHVEFNGLQYRRSFTLSRELELSKISAQMSEGVLTMVIPKGDAFKPRTIEIN